MAEKLQRPSAKEVARGEGASQPAGGERPAIVRMDQTRTSDVNVERATGNGSTTRDPMPIVTEDSNRTQILKP